MGAEVYGELAGGLDCVGVEECSGGVGDGGECLDGLDDAGLVVGEHDADEACGGANGVEEGVGLDHAMGVGSDEGDVDVAVFEGLGGVEDGVVFDVGGDDVDALLGGKEFRGDGAEESEVIALGAAGGEDDFGGSAFDQSSDLIAGVVNGGAGELAGLMDGAGVGVMLGPERTHGVEDLREEGCGRVGVHVYPAHCLILLRAVFEVEGCGANGRVLLGWARLKRCQDFARWAFGEKTMMKRILMTMVVSGCCVTSSFAQMGGGAPAVAPGTLVEPAASFNALLSATEGNLMSLAKAMPAEKYGFAPSATIFATGQKTEFAGVRTFGSLLTHIAQANYNYAARISGTKSDVDMAALGALKGKDEIVAALSKSFEFTHVAISTLTTRNAFESVRGSMTRISTAGGVVVHVADEYGQLVEYLRMNGMVPPASEKK